ncbi:MAG: alkaline phosphatase family protein, partial [Myxococcota bacterium]
MTSREAVKRGLIACTILLIGVGIPAGADAYVGPGAGIAFMTTALALFSTIFVVLFGSILWPIRWVYLLLTQKRPPKAPEISRAVVIGLDGIDPNIVRTLMDEGALPNMAKLAERGDFRELETTYPAMSPVAWSSFSTGVNPAKHGIYDFMTRDPRNYAPDLSSAEVRGPAKFLKIGKWQVPLGKPQVRLLKRSRPFWKILSTYRIPSSILRVPVTFPPDRFDGTMLSAMCVPDLQGSQGTFTHLVGEKKVEHADTPDDEDKLDAADDPYAVGTTRRVELNADGVLHTTLQGPPNPLRHDGHMLELPLSMKLDEGTGSVLVRVGNEQVELKPGVYSEWIELKFAMAPGFKMRGICRMRVLELDPMRLYISPINIDPANPVLPISHPKFFAVFLAKLIGRFTTLGLAEDTWALNEGVLDDEAFLEQAWLNHAEREAMLFQMLKRTPKGLVACVFDATDRIQHMFYRYRHDDHPALRDGPESERARYRRTNEDTNIRDD